ncbi:MAG: hypothetical protein SFU84_05305 [Gemmatimonadales bacterium]|nr:hypothetical protein [Gemmatimonadales bacterium]
MAPRPTGKWDKLKHASKKWWTRVSRKVGWAGLLPVAGIVVWLVLWYLDIVVAPADTWRPERAEGYWSMVAAFSAIIVGIAACLGLQSLWLTRRDITLRNERECRSCAIDRCRELAEVLIPLNQTVRAMWAAQQINPLPLKKKLPLVHQATDATYQVDSVKWVSAMTFEARVESSAFLNKLETWSAYFMHGLADHETGFRPCAAVFTAFVLQYYPYLVAARADPASGRYPNTVGLYRRWKKKLSEEEIEQVMKRRETMFPEMEDPDDDAQDVRDLNLDD